MKVYKKLFSYVPKKKCYGWLATLFSGFSVVLTVYRYYSIGVCQYSCRIFIFHLSKSRTSLWSVGLVIQ